MHITNLNCIFCFLNTINCACELLGKIKKWHFSNYDLLSSHILNLPDQGGGKGEQNDRLVLEAIQKGLLCISIICEHIFLNDEVNRFEVTFGKSLKQAKVMLRRVKHFLHVFVLLHERINFVLSFDLRVEWLVPLLHIGQCTFLCLVWINLRLVVLQIRPKGFLILTFIIFFLPVS